MMSRHLQMPIHDVLSKSESVTYLHFESVRFLLHFWVITEQAEVFIMSISDWILLRVEFYLLIQYMDFFVIFTNRDKSSTVFVRPKEAKINYISDAGMYDRCVYFDTG